MFPSLGVLGGRDEETWKRHEKRDRRVWHNGKCGRQVCREAGNGKVNINYPLGSLTYINSILNDPIREALYPFCR